MAREFVLLPKEKYESLIKHPKNEESSITPVNAAGMSTCSGEGGQSHKNGPTIPETTTTNESLSKMLTYVIAKKFRTKAEGLLHFLTTHGGAHLKWDGKGQIICEGETVTGSHIVDLIRDVVARIHTRKPKGYKCFYRALSKIHTPQSLFTNLDTEQMSKDDSSPITQGGGYAVKRKTVGAPPGYRPIVKSVKMTNNKWLKL